MSRERKRERERKIIYFIYYMYKWGEKMVEGEKKDMLNEEKLVHIIRDKLGKYIMKVCCGETRYVLLDGRIVNYRKAKNIYAELTLNRFNDPDTFVYFNSLTTIFADIVYDYIRKAGFTIIANGEVMATPAPDLKYYVTAYAYALYDSKSKSKYLYIAVYDIDAIANSLSLPRLIQQELKPRKRKIWISDVENLTSMLAEQPLGYTLSEAGDILCKYYLHHNKKYEDEVRKIYRAYSQIFPTPYQTCYKWDAKIRSFAKTTDCLKFLPQSFYS